MGTIYPRFNTLRLKQNGRRFADDVFKCIFLNENVCILIKISLKFVPKCPINNIPALVQVMVWRRSGDKPLSEPMMVRSPTHICVTRPQWVNHYPPHPEISKYERFLFCSRVLHRWEFFRKTLFQKNLGIILPSKVSWYLRYRST